MWRDPGFVAEGRVLYLPSLWPCLHTHWAHASSLPGKNLCSTQNWTVLPSLSPPHLLFLSCTLAEGLRAELLDMTPGRLWEWTPLFPPVLTSFSLVGTFSTGSKPTIWLVCVHGELCKTLTIEPSASGNRTKGLVVYLVPGVSSSTSDSHAFSISTKCST